MMSVFVVMLKRLRVLILPMCSALGVSGCSISGLVDTELPSSTMNPDAFKTPDAAVSLYRGAIFQFRAATTGYSTNPMYVVMSGLLGDELTTGQIRSGFYDTDYPTTHVDARDVIDANTASTTQPLWIKLHAVRQRSVDAIGSLQKYAPQSPKDRIGHVYALWGMAENFLADLFCSGIPLTLIQFEGGFAYGSASSNTQVYTHALAMFDSALAYTPDSAEYRYLAQVGKGWVLLNLKRYADAKQAVTGVPTDFVYKNLHTKAASSSGQQLDYVANFTFHSSGFATLYGPGTMADREGKNGLPYVSSNDPRTEGEVYSQAFGAAIRLPNRSAKPELGKASITMASGIEARLIEAEAALNANDPSWLTILNTLRTTCTVGAPCASPAPAGTGNIAGLAPLQDPGNLKDRIDMLFSERAFWLYLTGRRMGDMRRLVRNYGRNVEEVFPTGPYPAGNHVFYGTDVNLLPPSSEMAANPRYTGCIDRNA